MKNFILNPIKNDMVELIFDMQNEKVNKLSVEALKELDEALNQIIKSTYKTVVIKSAKDGIFIAGADIKEIEEMNNHDEIVKMLSEGNAVFNKLSNLNQTTIALIEGACMGGGLELALCCDYRVLIDIPKTKLALPEVKLGVMPGLGGTQRLPKLIGLQNSLGMILAGSAVDCKKAYRVGLADFIIPKGYEDFRFDEFLKSPKSRKTGGKFIEKFAPLRDYIYKKAHESLIKKTKGFYPAPLSALKIIKETWDLPVSEGLKKESEAFAKLALSDISKNMINLFFATEAVKAKKFKAKPKELKNTAVVGSGVMGKGLIWFFSNSGSSVRIIEPVGLKLIGAAINAVKKIYKGMIKRRKISRHDASFKLNSITYTDKYNGLSEVDLAVEVVLEDEKIKNEVYKNLQNSLNKDAIIATNTSSISINQLSTNLTCKENFVGLHFFNPVDRMPLVEIIPSKFTSDQTLASLYNYILKSGKTPVIVQDCAGFLVNRLLIPYVNEALHLASEGVPIQSIDKALVDFGMPMGPIELVDTVGIDIGYAVLDILHKAYGARMEPSKIIEPVYKKLKLLGKKGSKGFYKYSGKEKVVNEDINPYIKQTITLSDEEIVQRCIFIMINEASRCLEEKIVSKASELDLALIFGTGFPPFRGGLLRYADSLESKTIYSKLSEFQNKYGSRFEPAKLITKLSKNNEKFYKRRI